MSRRSPGDSELSVMRDIVGRIVTLPGDYGRGGGVVSDASFVKVIRLIR